MFGFLYSWFSVLLGLHIRCIKFQTLPNLRLLITSTSYLIISSIDVSNVSLQIMDVVRATEEQIMDAVRDTEDALLRPKSPGARSLGEDSERRSTTVRMEGHSSQMPQTSTVSERLERDESQKSLGWRSRPRTRGQFCRRGKYEAVCLPPAASLLDGPVSRNLQLFLCDKISPGFWAWFQLSRISSAVARVSILTSFFSFSSFSPPFFHSIILASTFRTSFHIYCSSHALGWQVNEHFELKETEKNEQLFCT